MCCDTVNIDTITISSCEGWKIVQDTEDGIIHVVDSEDVTRASFSWNVWEELSSPRHKVFE